MRRTREILRQKWVLGRTHRQIAASVGVSAGVVGKTVSRTNRAKLGWEAVETLDDDDLERRLYGERASTSDPRPEPDLVWVHSERKKPGVTLELLHIEYLEAFPNGLQYTAFCDRYRAWLKKRRLSMRQVHRAGEKLFVDFAGKKPRVVDPRTGVASEVELFVAVLGASNYTYVEAVESQSGRDWISAHVNALAFFGGAPEAIVPDQLKAGVTKACRYEPEVQRTYEELAEHYGTVVFPARPRKPKDKAKVEVGVQVVTRWVLARMRHETFFSLEALNERIVELVEELNDRVMKRYGKSRWQLFKELDHPALKPLPTDRFEFGVWKTMKVNIDYHIAVLGHFYSVPYRLRGERVDVRISATTVEIVHGRNRVAVHRRCDRPGHHTTDSEHMPKSHRAHLEWTPSRLIHWAGTIGPKTAELAKAILESRPHPEMGYRSCLGIMRLEKKFGRERLEAACARSLQVNARSYRHVHATLKNGMDRLPLPPPATQPADAERPAKQQDAEHKNVRGADYYH